MKASSAIFLLRLVGLALLVAGPVALAHHRQNQTRNFRIVRAGILYRSGQTSLAGLERKYFSAFFHSKVGATFTEWVRILRVSRAMELMRIHDNSIVRVAFAAGFQDVRTFERAFKRYVGVSPRAYRASVRPEHDRCREPHD